MSVYEEQLSRWAKAPSEAEEARCQSAVERISRVMKVEFGDSVRIFLQGSYKNRTNVKQDSDVDIVVCRTDVYFHNDVFLSENAKRTFQSLWSPSNYSFPEFRAKVESILKKEFAFGEVEPKERCIKVKGNIYRVNADVVPAFTHKRLRTGYPGDDHVEGIEFRTTTNNRVISFPDQHFKNGTEKNKNTSQMYKPIVRILKNVRNNLTDTGQMTLKEMPSFSLECLVWNVLPNSHFEQRTYKEAAKGIVARVWNDMRDREKADKYAEVSDLLWLFKGNTRITPQQAERFMLKAWHYIG